MAAAANVQTDERDRDDLESSHALMSVWSSLEAAERAAKLITEREQV